MEMPRKPWPQVRNGAETFGKMLKGTLRGRVVHAVKRVGGVFGGDGLEHDSHQFLGGVVREGTGAVVYVGVLFRAGALGAVVP